MAIIQISKLQARSGNLVDLPQLDEAEFAWASDDKRLFIGKTTPNENIEVLTGYSNISYSQITGSVGNLNVNPVTVADGQVLTYDGTNWVNRGGTANGLITLGAVSNVKITGGAIGYVLETDGLGNLAWTPKGTLYTNIIGLSNATPIVMTVPNTTPFTNDLKITISGANGASNSIVNGNSFYIRLASDYPTSGNVSLYTGTGATGPVNGTGLTYTNSPNAIVTAVVSGSGGSGAAQGSNTSIQFNNSGAFDGSADLTWDFGAAKLLTVNGNANVGNLNATGVSTATRFISNVATGTAPFTVTSTTQVANLNVATAGTVTTNAQPNITSVGSLTSLTVTGNANVGNLGTAQVLATANITSPQLISNVAIGTAPLVVTSTTQVANLNAATAGTVTSAAQANITSVGTLSAVTVTANVTTGGIKTDNYYYANGVSISFAGAYSNSNVASYLPTFTGTVGATALTTGANTTAGTITGNWALSTGSRLTATYADLAEYYTADGIYLPGTVVAFGGDQEVTIASDETNKVAGVVTTNPAFVMNEACTGPAVAIALQGRVPCKVTGIVYKGDMMVSAGNGYAKASISPAIGTVIGKSLENFDGIDGIIEVAIGKT